MDYNRKIDFAIKLLRSIPQDGPLEISYSGGKDSDVILRLAQMAGVPHESFIVRFLLPRGKVDRIVDGINYYWQAFNEAKRMMNSGAV